MSGRANRVRGDRTRGAIPPDVARAAQLVAAREAELAEQRELIRRRAIELANQEKMLRERERQIAEKRRIMSEEYRLLRQAQPGRAGASPPALAGKGVQPGHHPSSGLALNQMGSRPVPRTPSSGPPAVPFWQRIYRIITGVHAVRS